MGVIGGAGGCGGVEGDGGLLDLGTVMGGGSSSTSFFGSWSGGWTSFGLGGLKGGAGSTLLSLMLLSGESTRKTTNKPVH